MLIFSFFSALQIKAQNNIASAKILRVYIFATQPLPSNTKQSRLNKSHILTVLMQPVDLIEDAAKTIIETDLGLFT